MLTYAICNASDMAFIQLKRVAILLCVSMALSVPAAPTAGTVEVIPGPGLPSLESLGLTSADLFRISAASTFEVHINKAHGVLIIISEAVSAREEHAPFNKRVSVTCQDAPGNTVSAANAAACVAFLNTIGTSSCTITGSVTNFCEAGDAFINGTNISGSSSATTTW